MTQNSEHSFQLNPFLDERLISGPYKGGIRDWYCPSHCMAERVYWREIIENQFYQRCDSREITMLLLQPKLDQICDLIRSSEMLNKISLCLEGMIYGNQVLPNKPHRSLFYSSQKMDLEDERLVKITELISGTKKHQIAEVLMDVFEKSLNEDFPNLRNGKVLELLAAKIYFHC